MFQLVILILAIAASALLSEATSAYTLLEKHAVFTPENSSELIETHPIYKKEKPEPEIHPVYKHENLKNEGRARIEPVRSTRPVNYDKMLADQPAAPTTEVNRIDHHVIPNHGYVAAPGEVAYPDIPYAPGYSYDAGYPDSNGYDLYGNSLNNYLLEPDTSTFGLLWSQVPDSRTLVSYVGRTISWVFQSIFVLLLGSFLTVGVCSYTNLCTINFHGIGPIREEMRSLITPERLEKIGHAADFVKNAIDKYQEIQKVADGGVRRRRNIFRKI